MQDCPVCLEAIDSATGTVGMYECTHGVCKPCGATLIEYDAASCPCCRAPRKPEYNFSVHIVSGDRQLYWGDAGTYRVAQDGQLLAFGQAGSIQVLHDFLNHVIIFGVRFVAGSVGYVVYGPPGAAFLDLMAQVPEASQNTRSGRHRRIEMGRVSGLHTELISGHGLSPVDFVRTLEFPISILEHVDAESETESDVSEEGSLWLQSNQPPA